MAEDAAVASAALLEAEAAWQELGRPLDAARCEYLRGRLLRDADPEEARRALEAAATAAEEYGVGHLASLARDLDPCLTQTGNRTSQFRGLTVPHLTSPACRIWSVRGA